MACVDLNTGANDIRLGNQKGLMALPNNQIYAAEHEQQK